MFAGISDKMLDVRVVANGKALDKRQMVVIKTRGIAVADDGLGGT